MVLLDLVMPVMDGIAATRQVHPARVPTCSLTSMGGVYDTPTPRQVLTFWKQRSTV
ncbi:hypothetical protein GXW82_15020 [Streptacidiphilus sp. 4-A2]|nr:hypothetical protein [Streptacidiphilus sp. 4-A2]